MGCMWLCGDRDDVSSSEDEADQEQAAADAKPLEIGPPSDVKHITHVTFDRFKGFLGVPDDLEGHTVRKAPSAGQKVFGVKPETMQCAYDDYGNSVPKILLELQRRLYEQHGLETEGIFRVAAANEQEGKVREQLNLGLVPPGMDVHALAGLIKAWFRELPGGVLDSLAPEVLATAETGEQMVALVGSLPPMESSLLDWVVNLMADVVEHQAQNKMNSRNIAMVFAPNMTQVLDPILGLKHAVKVMELLRVLIDRKESQRIGAARALAQSSLYDDSDYDTDRESLFNAPRSASCGTPDEGSALDKGSGVGSSGNHGRVPTGREGQSALGSIAEVVESDLGTRSGKTGEAESAEGTRPKAPCKSQSSGLEEGTPTRPHQSGFSAWSAGSGVRLFGMDRPDAHQHRSRDERKEDEQSSASDVALAIGAANLNNPLPLSSRGFVNSSKETTKEHVAPKGTSPNPT